MVFVAVSRKAWVLPLLCLLDEVAQTVWLPFGTVSSMHPIFALDIAVREWCIPVPSSRPVPQCGQTGQHSRRWWRWCVVKDR